MTKATRLTFRQVASGAKDVLAILELARPETANAFDAAVINELTEALEETARNPRSRALVLRGEGKHFSAGADLAWMKAAAKLSYDENIEDAQQLIRLFETLTNLEIPTVAVVRGAAYGGAVGLAAACDIAIAAQGARFCLSEVRLGLLPAVIMPYLGRKIAPGQLRRLMLTGRVFGAEEALSYGLVQKIAAAEALESALREELDHILQGAPKAQAAIKKLHDRVSREGFAQGPHTAEAIAQARTGAEGQAGLAAFFAKEPAPWARTLPEDWSADVK